jgi:hypothetical protein
MPIFNKKEKPSIPTPALPTPISDEDQWLTELRTKHPELIDKSPAPSPEKRNQAAIAQSTQQHIETHFKKK